MATKPNLENMKHSSVFWTIDFVSHKYKQQKYFKIVGKIQCLKNCLQLNISEGSVSSIYHLSSKLFWLCDPWRGMGVKFPPSYFFLDRELLFIDLKVGTHTK